MTQVIRTVLEVDASRAVAGFRQGAAASGTYAAGLKTASTQAASTTNSLGGIDRAAGSTSGSLKALGAGTTAAAAGMGKTANSMTGLGDAASASNVSLQALASGGFKGLDASTATAESALSRFNASMRTNRAEWDQLGNTAMVAGGAIVGGLGLAAKAAIDWESAWAGVKKTTDGTPEQMAALEEELRGLTKVLPATHEEIAGVAEAAGQLGVARDDIADFTETAVALGESTNLSAEEAATGLAKISNVMGTQAEYGIEGIERMGSALVALGNDGASTESDILAMGQRIAGAGKTVGATEADVLALANALSSVGVEAQLGGGAMSRALLEMDSAVKGGGESLEAFAEIAGMSASEFASSWREDPVAATNEFISGLGRIQDSGGDASAALDSVGLSGTENAQVFLRAAGASDLLTESLALGASAWEANTALSEEAAQRYETDAAQIQMAWNTIKDAAITAGGDIAPVVAGIASGVAELVDAFAGLPGPVKSFVTATAALAGGGLLLGGAAIRAVGFAQDLTGALGKVGPAGTGAASGLDKASRAGRGLAKWGGYALGAAAVVTVLGEVVEAATPAPASIEEVTSALLDLKQAGDQVVGLEGLDKVFTGLDDQSAFQRAIMDTSVGVDGLADAFRRLNDPTALESTTDFIGKFQTLLPGVTNDVEKLEGEFATFGESLANMPAERAAQQFDLLVGALGGGEETAKRLLELMPAYQDSLTGAENASRMAADGTEELAGGLSEAEQAAADAEAAIDDLITQLEMMGGGFRAEQAASRAVTESLKEMQDVVKSGEGGWDALSASMSQSAEDALAFAGTQVEMGRSSDVIAAGLQRARDQVIQSGVDAGKSRPFMEAYADSIGLIPSEAKTMIEAAGAGQAKLDVLALDESIMLLNGKTVTVKEAGALASQGRVKGLKYEITTAEGKTVKVTEIGSTAAGNRVVLMDGKIRVLKGKDVEVTEHGATAAEGRVDRMRNSIQITKGKQVDVGVRTYGQAALRDLQRQINAMTGRSITVTTRQRTIYETQGVRVSGVSGRGGMTNADGGIAERVAGGGLHRYMADGGVASFAGQPPQIRAAGGAGVTWAEDGAGPWEAFISGHPAKKNRSRSIADEVVGRLGGSIQWPRMADGGLMHFSRHYTPTAPAPLVVQSPSTQAAASLVGGDLVLQSTGDTREDLAETMFQLRRIRRGGL